MPYKLVCTQPFHDRPTNAHIGKGQQIHDQDEVARHLRDREKHFVKVPMNKAEQAAEADRQAQVALAAKARADKSAPAAA
jgi:hypothetical protein